MIGGYRMCTVGCAYSARCVRAVGARRAYGARAVRVRCAYGARTVRVRCAQCVRGARATRVRCACGAHTARARCRIRAAHMRCARDACAVHASAVRVWRARSVVHFGLAHPDFVVKVCVCVPRCFFPNLTCLSKYDVFFEVGCAFSRAAAHATTCV